ncbi:hypothetical protein PSPO01_13218 [Paraphaeosphaeria sporulosa]
MGHLAPTNWRGWRRAGYATQCCACASASAVHPKSGSPSPGLLRESSLAAGELIPRRRSESGRSTRRGRPIKTKRNGDKPCHLREEAGALLWGASKQPSSQMAMRMGELARLARRPLLLSDTLAGCGRRDSLRSANAARAGLAVGVCTAAKPGTAGPWRPVPCACPRAVLPISAPRRRGRLSLPQQRAPRCRAPAQAAGFSTTPSLLASFARQSRAPHSPSLPFALLRCSCVPYGRLHSLSRPGVRSF